MVIEALTSIDRTSSIKLCKNNARSRLFCRITKMSIAVVAETSLFIVY